MPREPLSAGRRCPLFLGSPVLCSPRTIGMPTNASIARTEPDAMISVARTYGQVGCAPNRLGPSLPKESRRKPHQHVHRVVTGADVHTRGCFVSRRLQSYAAMPSSFGRSASE